MIYLWIIAILALLLSLFNMRRQKKIATASAALCDEAKECIRYRTELCKRSIEEVEARLSVNRQHQTDSNVSFTFTNPAIEAVVELLSDLDEVYVSR
jgi:hypothetical protein